MDKSNIFRSSRFYMWAGDTLNMKILDETGTALSVNLIVAGSDPDDEPDAGTPIAPVATNATNLLADGFTANWGASTLATGYYLDVATDSSFASKVIGYNTLDVSNVLTYAVTGLSAGTPYYYRITAYNTIGSGGISNTITTTTTAASVVDGDGNGYSYVTIGTQQWLVENLKTTKYIDGTPIPNISDYDDWFLPSIDELQAIYDEITLYALGDFIEVLWSSSETDATTAKAINFGTGVSSSHNKFGGPSYHFVPCRAFTSSVIYALRDISPAGGYIFHITDLGGGSYRYYEVRATMDANGWSWIHIDWQATLLSVSDTAIGAGQANTTAIVTLTGDAAGPAKECNDLTSDDLWAADTDGAYCWYDNDEATYKPDYGALYNWYAVDNAHGLAPTGWRVPTASDFSILSTALGGDNISGGTLKEIGLVHWNTPNTGADNSSGFTAIGGGYRIGTSGSFSSINDYGFHWASNQVSSTDAYLLALYYNDIKSYPGGFSAKKDGCTVRCMRDTP